MAIRGHGATHTGLVRPANEDAYHVGSWVCAVADGVGGAPAGEVASRIAVQSVAALDEHPPAGVEDAGDRLLESVRAAARGIAADLQEHPDRAGMATTLTVAGIWEHRLLLAHVGDSRAYLLHDGKLEQLTRDHTAVEEAVESGLIDRIEAARHPERHLLLRVVNEDPDVPIATWSSRPLEPRDRLLLCSDGLTEVCDDVLIAEVLDEAGAPETATDSLIEATLARGAPDNVTVVVVDIG